MRGDMLEEEMSGTGSKDWWGGPVMGLAKFTAKP